MRCYQIFITRIFIILTLTLLALPGSALGDALPTAAVTIHPGAGRFSIQGGPGHQDVCLTVYYYRPQTFTPDSPILLVIPGGGRDGDEYRDAWIDAAEAHGVLVLSPVYRKAQYDFGWYHFGGLIAETNVEAIIQRRQHSHQVVLDDAQARYEINNDRETYIFNDFERIFDHAVAATQSRRTGYDLFGHSAGGQILHRMVLLQKETRAQRIVAGNSGFYTLPDMTIDIPYGLNNTPVNETDLRRALAQPLILLLGEADHHPEAGGVFLRSPGADRQGEGRLQRGRFFFNAGRAQAQALQTDFNWRLETVPGVGHDFRKMSPAAAALLYGQPAQQSH